jgi:hypothetical protein
MTRMTATNIARCVLAAALLPTAQLVLADSTRYGLDTEFTHDDNASRGLYSADRKADNILAAEGFVVRSMLLSERSGATFRGGARYSQFFEFKDISNLALSGRAAYRYQIGSGFSSPWIEITGEYQWLKHADSALRDGSIVSIGANVGSHVTDRVRVSGGLGTDKRSGDSTGVYELSTNRLWGTFDYRLGLRNTIYARLSRVAGDHVFNSGPVTGLSGVWASDPAIASGLGIPLANAYRLEATTLLYELGLNYPLLDRHAVDISVSKFTSKADASGYKYDGNQLRAGYLYRF